MNFTLLYQLWHPKEKYLESSSLLVQNGHDPISTRNRAIQTAEELARRDNAKILRLGIFDEKGITEITETSVLHNPFFWKNTWKGAQSETQAAIQLKHYGLQTHSGYNLSCADFRCMGTVSITKSIEAYKACSGQHSEKDPYYGKGIEISWDEKKRLLEGRGSEHIGRIFDQEHIFPLLARRLHEKRGTKEQALARFECWKQDIEHRLQYWNPF